MKLHKNCKGCTLEDFTCLIKYDHELISKCPCCNCLVKMVCETRCSERIKSFELLPTTKKEELTNKDLAFLKKQLKANKIGEESDDETT